MSLNVNNNVGYTVVDGGSISVVNGIASGFSTDDYLDLSQKIDITQNVHIHIDVLSFAATGASQYIFGLANGGGASGGLYFGSTAVGMAFSYGNSYWTNIAAGLTVGTPLTVDVVSDGIDFSITVNQGTYTKTSTKTLADLGITGSYTLRLGKLFQAFTSGAINLNKTYVKINGITWFNGKQQASHTVNEVYLNRNVGYTVVGNPAISNGVVSGFSASDYLTMPSFNPGNNPWEMVLCFNTPQELDMNSWRILFGTKNANQKGIRILSGVSGSSKYFQVIFTGPSGRIGHIGEQPTATPLQPNTKTWIKTIFNGSVYKVYTSLNGSDYTEVSESVTSSTSISSDNSEYHFGDGLSSSSASISYTGSIDLNNTYIKVNGVTWFSGKEQASPTVNEVYLNRNVGYDIVGNPTIVDGVASGFTTDNYVRTVKIFPTSNISTLEWGCKFTTGSNVNYQGITGTGSYWGCYGFKLGDYGAFGITLSFSPDITIRFPASTIKSNSTYISKAYWNATTKEFSAKVSGDNGKTWTTSSMVVSDDFSYRDVPVQFGRTQAGNFRGSIDLNNTYIKVNGVTWFNGKDVNFSNQNNYIINNGNLVWANPNLWLQGDGASYIDTGIYGFNTTDYELCWKQIGSSDYYGVFGSRKSTSEDRLTIITGAPGESDKYIYVSNYNGTSYQTTYRDLTAYQKRILTKNSGTLTLNGVDKTILTDKEYQTPTTLKLYVVDTNGSLSSFFIGNIYYTKIYNNNTLVRHLVPVPKGLVIGNYTVPSNGMWDIVTQTFFGNQGTGSFTFGKDGTTPVWTR